MIRNILQSSGQAIALAVGQNYTLKDDEVAINGEIYKKYDLEISLTNTASSNEDDFIGIGIKKRDGVLNLPADFSKFNEWEINNVAQTDLSDCVTSITSLIQYVIDLGNGSSSGSDSDSYWQRIENADVHKIDGNSNENLIQNGDIVKMKVCTDGLMFFGTYNSSLGSSSLSTSYEQPIYNT